MTYLVCDDPNYSELLRVVRSGKSVVYIGSGLSVEAGYPSWKKLVADLCSECGAHFPTDAIVESDELLDLAERCYQASQENYLEALTNAFSKPVTLMPRNYTYLFQSPFKSYITTNYDPLLAEEGRGKSSVYTHRKGLDVTKLRDRGTFYIHGYVEADGKVKDNDLILTQGDFDRAYNPEESISIPSFLTQLFQFHSIIFLGCQLKEPPIRKLFEICEKARKEIQRNPGAILPKHFILLPKKEIKVDEQVSTKEQEMANEVEDDWYEKNGLSVVRYVKREDAPEHIQLLKILEEWSGLPSAKAITPFDAEVPIL
jgi:hypothetical protein